jgi:putative ABC transport system ATP-binding protein
MSLVLSDLHKSYRQGEQTLPILKGLSLSVNSGEVVAILGQSGSGKSTLLGLLAGLDRPDSGQIVINQRSLLDLTEGQRTVFRGQHIGIVFQQFHLMQHLTALENIMLPLEILKDSDPEKKASVLLGQVGLAHRSGHYPRQLSGGECQRVAMARALVTQPSLLLADEPSGNLDALTGRQVMDVFFEIVKAHSITTILVTHSIELAERCDRQLHLVDGKL